MSRSRRSDVTQPVLHVFSRGADRQDIFSADRDRVRFEYLMGDAVERSGVRVFAYALMHNHVHLLVDRTDGDLPAAMHHLFGQYASAYNERTQRSGPLFGGRYGVTPIETDEQLVQCSRYIHRNPLEFVPIEALVAYRWSSLAVYADRRSCPDWLTTAPVATLLHDSPTDYLRFVLAPQRGDGELGVPRSPWETLDLDDVDRVVASRVDCDPSAIVAVGREGRSDARVLAVTVATDLRLASSRELAAHYGLRDGAASRGTARRGRIRVAGDTTFRHLFVAIRAELIRLTERAGFPTTKPTERTI